MYGFSELFRHFARIQASQFAIKSVVFGVFSISLLSACGSPPGAETGQRYRCERGIEFTARFKDESVTLDTAGGRELLFRGGPHVRDAKNPNEYGNALAQIEFNTGQGQAREREAVLRYPLLPLVVRCVKD